MKIIDLFEMTQSELMSTRAVIAKMFDELDMKVHWTHHFNDERRAGREEDVEKEELLNAFRKMMQKYGPDLQYAARIGALRNVEIVLKDMASELNIPFEIRQMKGHRAFQLRGITIMRKDPNKFHTRPGDLVLVVESAAQLEPMLDDVENELHEYPKAVQADVKKRIRKINDLIAAEDVKAASEEAEKMMDVIRDALSENVITEGAAAIEAALDDIQNELDELSPRARTRARGLISSIDKALHRDRDETKAEQLLTQLENLIRSEYSEENEEKGKKGSNVKAKSAKRVSKRDAASVYRRDYLKTRHKDYRQYDPED